MEWSNFFSGIGGVFFGALISWVSSKTIENEKLKNNIRVKTYEDIVETVNKLKNSISEVSANFSGIQLGINTSLNGMYKRPDIFDEEVRIFQDEDNILYTDFSMLKKQFNTYKFILSDFESIIASIVDYYDRWEKRCIDFSLGLTGKKFDSPKEELLSLDKECEELNNALLQIETHIDKLINSMQYEFLGKLFHKEVHNLDVEKQNKKMLICDFIDKSEDIDYEFKPIEDIVIIKRKK